MGVQQARELIWFTKTFPYEKGETFIESEIVIASNYYDCIYIIACQVRDTSVMRNIPDNVKVFSIPAESRKQLLLLGLKTLCFGKKDEELIREWKRCNSIKQRLFSAYFYSKVEKMYQQCIDVVRGELDCKKEYMFYSYWFFDTALLASRLKTKFEKEYNIHFVTRAHGYDLYEYRNIFSYFPFRYQIFENVDGVFPCSNNGEKYLKKHYPGFAEKITTSYLGTGDYGIRDINYQKNEISIVTCSNLIPLKRIDRLPGVLKMLEEKGYQIKWTCFGDGKMAEDIKKSCRKYLKKTSVVFKGFVTNSEIMTFYANEDVDVFINISETEGLPVAIMEAMSYGIPAIATNVGGTAELVIDNCTGILLDKNFKDKELRDAIVKIGMMKEEKKKVLRRNCREHWAKTFCDIDNYENFYKTLGKIQGEKVCTI